MIFLRCLSTIKQLFIAPFRIKILVLSYRLISCDQYLFVCSLFSNITHVGLAILGPRCDFNPVGVGEHGGSSWVEVSFSLFFIEYPFVHDTRQVGSGDVCVFCIVMFSMMEGSVVSLSVFMGRGEDDLGIMVG